MIHYCWLRAGTVGAVAAIVCGGAATAHTQSLDVDRKLGADAVAEVESTYGIVEDEAATAWVAAVGERLVTGLGPQPFEYSFRLVNMTEPNAFALPAGHVFVAPSLLAVARSEDELAGLLGHEIIHAHERHSIKRLRRGLRPGLLSLPGAVVGSVVNENLGKLLNAPLSTLTQLRQANYSRGQEKDSDRQGAELAARAGYDPAALASLLERIDTGMEIVTGAASHFSYFDSHPFTPDRARDIRKHAAKLRPADTPSLAPGPEQMLVRLDGLPVGPDPAQGVFQESVFLHPEMGFAIDFPAEWEAVNTASVVGAYEPEKRAQLFLGPADGEPEALAAAFVRRLREEYRTTPTSASEVSAEGRTAHMVTLEEATKQGVVSLNVLWLKLGEQTFQVLAAGAEKHRAAMRESLLSLRPLSDDERQSVTAVYLRGATARVGDTLESLGEREGNVLQLDVLALMNGLAADATLAEGQAVRIGRREPYRSRP